MDILDIMMAKKLSGGGGGGSDPIVENAKTTGGIGWTESGKRAIEWDGDTEGKVQISIQMSGTTIPANIYKICGNVPDISELVGGEIIIVGGNAITITNDMVTIVDGLGYILINGVGYVMFANAGSYVQGPQTILVPENGMYFIKLDEDADYVSYLSYSSTAIHKINEKYLPEDIATQDYVNQQIGDAIGGEY